MVQSGNFRRQCNVKHISLSSAEALPPLSANDSHPVKHHLSFCKFSLTSATILTACHVLFEVIFPNFACNTHLQPDSLRPLVLKDAWAWTHCYHFLLHTANLLFCYLCPFLFLNLSTHLILLFKGGRFCSSRINRTGSFLRSSLLQNILVLFSMPAWLELPSLVCKRPGSKRDIPWRAASMPRLTL